MKKPPAAKAAKNYKKLSDRMIKILLTLKHTPRSGYQDLVMRSELGIELDNLLKSEVRYEWRRLGCAYHLINVSEPTIGSIAYVLPTKGKTAEWHVTGRKAASGTAKSMTEAKAKIELYFETINEQE